MSVSAQKASSESARVGETSTLLSHAGAGPRDDLHLHLSCPQKSEALWRYPVATSAVARATPDRYATGQRIVLRSIAVETRGEIGHWEGRSDHLQACQADPGAARAQVPAHPCRAPDGENRLETISTMLASSSDLRQ